MSTIFNGQTEARTDMNPHSLPPNVQGIGHGIQLSSQGAIQSGTLGCYLDAKGAFHYGYFYLNGSNNRVVTWEDDHRVNRTVNRSAPIFLFSDVITPNSFRASLFRSEDFNFPWLDAAAQVDLQNELSVQDFHNFISQVAGLSLK